MATRLEEFVQELGGKADQVQRPVLEALAEIPGATGQDIRMLAVSAFRRVADGTRLGRFAAHDLVQCAISAVLHVGPEDWLPNLVQVMDASTPKEAAGLRELMRALKKARRAIEERDDPEPW